MTEISAILQRVNFPVPDTAPNVDPRFFCLDYLNYLYLIPRARYLDIVKTGFSPAQPTNSIRMRVVDK